MSPAAGGAKVPVAVLGATGLVGQHLVRLLEAHPWFELAEVMASPERAGARYGASVDWVLGEAPPLRAASLRLGAADGPVTSPLVLSALPGGPARSLEASLARRGHLVCSNASAHRMEDDVPLVVPEVNPEALSLLGCLGGSATGDRGTGHGDHRDTRGGGIVTNPNCVVAGLVPVLAPLEARWGVESGAVVTLQALSGAGLAGPSALQALGNVVPNIAGEEEKIAREVAKILGREVPLAVTVNRVPVRDGHMAHLFLRLRGRASPEEVTEALAGFRSRGGGGSLPSLPERPVRTLADPFRPQPALDIHWSRGMGVTVGRVREVPGFTAALTLVVHNAVRGAAGACLANAELAYAKGWVEGSTHPDGAAEPAAASGPAGTAVPP